MANAVWAGLGLVALLWPSRIAGPFDGAPFDTTFEAVAVAAVLCSLWLQPRLLRSFLTRALIASLLLFNATASLTASMQGWCLQFVSPVPLFRETGRIPHSWDVRADWRSAIPQCSAIMRRSYSVLEEFPVWFYNLPPVHEGSPARKEDRPPLVELDLTASGYFIAPTAGSWRVQAGDDVRLRADIDGSLFEHEQVNAGVQLPAGVHRVWVYGRLKGSHWSMRPLWNDRDLWSSVLTTTTAPSSFDAWTRWVRYVPALLLSIYLIAALIAIMQRAGSPLVVAVTAVASVAVAALPFTGSPAATRLGALALFAPIFLPVPRRLRNAFGASLLVGVPFLAIFLSLGLPQIGTFTWYSSGDDWWMFQRYGYRIFMEGHWIEGGQLTFWFQPLYRWINGALHLAFGDSSVGELWSDAASGAIGAFFAFIIVRRISGYRWAIVAASITLAILLLGPPWYLFGRGLSEFSSMGLIYGAAITAMRARRGHVGAMIATGIMCTAAFYTRLNNLPMVCAIAVFAFPTRVPVFDVWRPATWRNRASRPAMLAVFGGIAVAVWLFTLRTYYFTGFIDMFYGTQAADRAVWKSSESIASNLQGILSSIAMVVTMNDPPGFDVRAVPVAGGILAAIAGLLGVKGLRGLPLNASALAIAGLAGAVVARGSAYPGRFSLHLIPAAVAVFVCALSLMFSRRRPRSAPPGHQSPGMM